MSVKCVCVGLVTLWLSCSWWGMNVLHSPGARQPRFILSPSPSGTGAWTKGQRDWLITNTRFSSPSRCLFAVEVMASALPLFVFSLARILHCGTETEGVKCGSCSIQGQNHHSISFFFFYTPPTNQTHKSLTFSVCMSGTESGSLKLWAIAWTWALGMCFILWVLCFEDFDSLGL